MATPLEDYALLGDRRTAALVSRDGSVDWWCVPRFDQSACFAALLGKPENGRFAISPVHKPTQTTRRYRAGTMVLVTEHQTSTGRVRVTDCLALESERPTLVRLVEGLEGRVEMLVELIVRFDYGSIVPWVRRTGDEWRAIAGPDGLELRTPIHVRGRDHTTCEEFTVNAGDRVPFVLGWFPSHDPQPIEKDGAALLDRTVTEWKQWAARCTYHGAWNDQVLRSLLTLEALTYAPTGGIVAAPTRPS